MLRNVTSAHKGLTPSGKKTPTVLVLKNLFVFLEFFQSFQRVCSAHAGHTQRLGLMRVSVGFKGHCTAQTFLLMDRNVARTPARVLASIVVHNALQSPAKLYRTLVLFNINC